MHGKDLNQQHRKYDQEASNHLVWQNWFAERYDAYKDRDHVRSVRRLAYCLDGCVFSSI
jgi:hypothetical protein